MIEPIFAGQLFVNYLFTVINSNYLTLTLANRSR